MACFDHFQGLIGQCDQEVERRLRQWSTAIVGPAPLSKARQRTRNTPKLDLLRRCTNCWASMSLGCPEWIRIRCCVLSVKPGQHCQSQRFPAWQTLRHELCPGTKISGGKIQSSKTARVANKAARAFRLAAQAAGRIETAIGAFYRRIKSRAGVPSAQASVGF